MTRHTELHGLSLKPGDKVMLGFGAASRDPEAFEDPTTIDIHRQAQGHIISGAGIHRCLGSHLARREIQVAIEEFISAIPTFRLASDANPHWFTSMTREVSGVRIVWE